jgi:hypothetical protein
MNAAGKDASMDLRRRFIFRGNAAAIGGRIVRPADVVIDSGTASSLTVAGGRSRARAATSKFGEWVSFAAASTSAEGVFDDVKQEIELTFHHVPEDCLAASTRVMADVTGLSIGDKPKLTVKGLHAALSSRSPAASGEPSIALGSDTVIDGAAIESGGVVYGLSVDLAVAPFQQYDTRSKLLTAADDPQFVREWGDCLFMKLPVAGAAAPPAGRLQHGAGTIYATIVKAIRWTGDQYPGARIDQHSLVVPNFGTIFFGELLITALSRRLTMLRVELGSPIGGFVACAEVENNGAWSN